VWPLRRGPRPWPQRRDQPNGATGSHRAGHHPRCGRLGSGSRWRV